MPPLRARFLDILIVLPGIGLAMGATAWAQMPPYPPSSVIEEITFDWSTHRRAAQGSDNFQLTWGDDGHQYGWWGDGGGFGSSSSDGRVSLGFARIEGDWDDWKGFNVWGGKNPENPATFTGKSWGTISVDGVLYSWIVPDLPDTGGPRDHYRYIELARSRDHGATWTKADWRWQIEDNLIVPTFLNFGQDNAGARDEYVYSYFIRPQSTDITQSTFGLNVHKPGAVFLARVDKDRLFEGRDHYEWFTGIREGEATWGDLDSKQPVFEDPNGTGWCLSASYNPGLDRYLLATEHTRSHVDNLLGIFDAPEPWGPWTTVEYWTPDDRFGETRPGSDLDWKFNVFFLAFSPKWLSDDGRDFTLTFTGGGRGKDNDSFNTLRGRAVKTKSDGFSSLFDGRSLDGWQGGGEGWTAEGGNLVYTAARKGKDSAGRESLKLMSDQQYSDFILRFEFKLQEGANNGVAVRAPLQGDPAFLGMEIQVIDTEGWPGRLKPFQVHGSIYGVVPAKTGHLKPAGQWNTQEIVCEGRRVKVTHNGAVIVDAHLVDVQPIDGREHPGLKQDKGHIGFLGHTRGAEFRNIWIKELRSTRSIFNDK